MGNRDIHCHPAEPRLLPVPSEHNLSALLFAACPAGTFKASQGAGLCAPCPPNSRSSAEASPLCACRNGYYRADLDPPAAACTSEYWEGTGGRARSPQLCLHSAVLFLVLWGECFGVGERGSAWWRVPSGVFLRWWGLRPDFW